MGKRESARELQARARRILWILKKKYPKPRIALRAHSPFELLAATILSAQCTDKRVNGVTKDLFKRYRTVKDYARADIKELEQAVRSTGFYRNKAKNIIGAAKWVIKDYAGQVPRSMGELIRLPGVARKTANVVLSGAFGVNEGVAVDTHVRRVSGRLGLSQESDPVHIEKDLMRLFEKREWGNLSLRLIFHGRRTCGARQPQCVVCVLQTICPSFEILSVSKAKKTKGNQR